MYEAFFSLGNRPFLGAPSIERYFPAGAIEHARQALVRCIERGQGPGLLIGPAGTGKSLVCQMLADQFRSMFRVVVLVNPRLSSRRALLQSILFELGLPYRELDEGELRLSLAGHLEPSDDCPHGLLLIVDEAEGIPLRLFDELRSLTNQTRNGQPRVRLILAGGASLEERFTHPKLESFNQRVAARCYLQALSRNETRDYVRGQIGSVGGLGDAIFPDDATEAVYRATDGIPRLINQVCDAAMYLAAQANQHFVDARLVELAWAELQQLPAPWQIDDRAVASRDTTGVIEFGLLDEAETLPAKSAEAKHEPEHGHVSGPASDTLAQLVGGCASPAAHDSSATVACGCHWADSLQTSVDNVLIESWMPSEPSKTDDITGNADVASETAADRAPMAVPTHNASSTVASDANVATIKDPFGDGFAEEEVVSDRYAKMEVDAIRARIRVSSPQGREIAWSLQNLGRAVADEDPRVTVRRVLPPRPVEATEPVAGVADSAELPVEARTVELAIHDSSDPVQAVRPHIRLLPDDDRDLLVADNDGARVAPQPTEEGRVVRREYRQLFARLRRR